MDYSGVSGSVGGLRISAEEFNTDYFTPHPSSVKTTHLRLDELGSDEQTQPPASEMPEALIPPEPSLSSPTLAASCSEDSFPVVIGAPTTSQTVVVTPSVVMAKIPFTVSLPALATLPVDGKDLLKFSFKAASGVREASGDGPSESTPISLVAPAINEGGASPWILVRLAPYSF